MCYDHDLFLLFYKYKYNMQQQLLKKNDDYDNNNVRNLMQRLDVWRHISAYLFIK